MHGDPVRSSRLPAPGRETLPHTQPADTLTWDFQPPDLGENEFLVLKPPSLWLFVMAALEVQDGENNRVRAVGNNECWGRQSFSHVVSKGL